MKKSNPKALKRIVTKTGQVRFYQGGKQLSSIKAQEILKERQRKRVERAKQSSRDLLYYKGKALSKLESLALKDVLNAKIVRQNEKRLDRLLNNKGELQFPNRNSLNELLSRTIPLFFNSPTNSYGRFKNGYKGGIENLRGVLTLLDFLRQGEFRRFQWVLTKPNFSRTKDKLEISRFLIRLENELLEIIEGIDPSIGLLTQFVYKVEIGWNMKQLYIDLSEVSNIPYEEQLRDAILNQERFIQLFSRMTIEIGYS